MLHMLRFHKFLLFQPLHCRHAFSIDAEAPIFHQGPSAGSARRPAWSAATHSHALLATNFTPLNTKKVSHPASPPRRLFQGHLLPTSITHQLDDFRYLAILVLFFIIATDVQH